jgi:hypothetical protein
MAEALNFAAPSIAGLAGFAMQVVQAMYLVDGNDLGARFAKRQSTSSYAQFQKSIASVRFYFTG